MFARANGGRFLLRIDDTDRARSEERFVEAIRADLDWLGLMPDGEVRQSARFDAVRGAVRRTASRRGASIRRTRPRRNSTSSARSLLGRGLPPVYDRAALALSDAERAALEAEGVAAALALPARPRRADRLGRPDPRAAAVRSGDDERSGRPPRRRVVALPAAERDRRYRHGHHPCRARRGSCVEHRGAAADVRQRWARRRRPSRTRRC